LPPTAQGDRVTNPVLSSGLEFPHRRIDRPYLFMFPAIGAVAATVLALSILRHNDRWPFYTVAVIFVSAFGTLALSFWPYMIPVDEAAAPPSSLMFMFWGGVVVFSRRPKIRLP
jgi:cytochrome d ubiquinol oxidase subunit II